MSLVQSDIPHVGTFLTKALVFVTAAIQLLLWRDRKKTSTVGVEGSSPLSSEQNSVEEKKMSYTEVKAVNVD